MAVLASAVLASAVLASAVVRETAFAVSIYLLHFVDFTFSLFPFNH